MLNKKNKYSIPWKDWPFAKDAIAKLYWIDHPFKNEKGNWRMNVYFKDLETSNIVKCNVDWGNLNMLRIGRLYKEGRLLQNELIPNNYLNSVYISEREFEFNNENFVCRADKHSIFTTDGKEHVVHKNAFIAKAIGYEFHIPVLEVIRSLLATNKRLTYAILEPNSLDYFFILERDYRNPRKLIMNFSNNYPYNLLTPNHISHLIWLSVDRIANKAWNEVYKSARKFNDNGLVFSFPFHRKYTIKARYRQKGNIIRIEEILKISGQAVPYSVVEVNSPYNYEYRNTNESKKRKIIDSNDKELNLDFKNEKSKKAEEILEIAMTEHEFQNTPSIYKVPHRKVNKRSNEDENTETIIKNNENTVSTADLGGIDGIKGLEFKELDNIKEIIESNDIAQMLNVLRALKENYPKIQIRTSIGNVPFGNKSRLFATLDDGVTPRKYLLAMIRSENRNVRYLLEVERMGKSLSTLLLYFHASSKVINIKIFNSILEGLVDNNGTWDNTVLAKLFNSGIRSERIRHTRTIKNDDMLAKRFYSIINRGIE